MDTSLKLIKLEQGSQEWLEWRKGGIGASEAGIICGSLPEAWDGLFAYTKRKTHGTEKFFSEEARIRIKRGQDMEEEARQAYARLTGNQVEAVCIIHPEHEYLRASLDGITSDLKTVVEIKCSGKNVYDKVSIGKIPDYYYSQLQHQLAVVPCAERSHFWMYNPELGKPLLFDVPRDEDYIAEMVYREAFVWDAIQRERKLFSGQLGPAIKINHDGYKMLYGQVPVQQDLLAKTKRKPRKAKVV